MTIISFKDALKKNGVSASDVKSVQDNTITQQQEGQKGLEGFSTGVFKDLLGTAVGTASLLQKGGQYALAAIDPTKNVEQVKSQFGFPSLDTSKPEGKFVSDIIQPKGSAEKAGAITSSIAQFLIPLGEVSKAEKVASTLEKGSQIISETAPKVKGIIQEAPNFLAKQALGKDAELIKSAQNPAVKLFKEGKMKVSDVVNTVESGIQKFVDTSKANLQSVKNAIPDVQIEVPRIAEKINKGITDSIQHSADYRGIKTGLDTAEEIIGSGVLNPEETRVIKSVSDFAGKWKDTSARGVLNLKESLQNFVKNSPGYEGSNAMIRSIQRNLKDLVGEVSPEIKPALDLASKNIDKTEQIVEKLFGKDVVSGESKILNLARNFGDKAKNAEKLRLVKELEKESGMDIMSGLKNIYDYIQASKIKAPGFIKPVEQAKYLLKKGIEKGVKIK